MQDGFVKNVHKAFPCGKLVAGRITDLDRASLRIEMSLKASDVTGEKPKPGSRKEDRSTKSRTSKSLAGGDDDEEEEHSSDSDAADAEEDSDSDGNLALLGADESSDEDSDDNEDSDDSDVEVVHPLKGKGAKAVLVAESDSEDDVATVAAGDSDDEAADDDDDNVVQLKPVSAKTPVTKRARFNSDADALVPAASDDENDSDDVNDDDIAVTGADGGVNHPQKLGRHARTSAKKRQEEETGVVCYCCCSLEPVRHLLLSAPLTIVVAGRKPLFWLCDRPAGEGARV